jgi:hypothetical protein
MLCDELVDGHYGVLSHISYLAPRTVVFMPRIPLSMKVYSSAGIVDKAGMLVSNLSLGYIVSQLQQSTYDQGTAPMS